MRLGHQKLRCFLFVANFGWPSRMNTSCRNILFFLSLILLLDHRPLFATTKCRARLLKLGEQSRFRAGSYVDLEFEGVSRVKAVFLGIDLDSISDHSKRRLVFYEISTGDIHLIPESSMQLFNASSKPIDSVPTALISRRVQNGDTCLPRATYNCLLTFAHDLKHNERRKFPQLFKRTRTFSENMELYLELKGLLSGEQERFMDSIGHHVQNVLLEKHLTKLGVPFDKYRSFDPPNMNPAILWKTILKNLEQGAPVILNYAAYREDTPTLGKEVFLHDHRFGLDERIGKPAAILPSLRGKPGRHSVVALGIVPIQHRNLQILVSDSATGHFFLWDEGIVREELLDPGAQNYFFIMNPSFKPE